jgi:hypothetical protein
VTLIEQTDRALALAANQFAGHSIVLDKLVHDTITTTLPNGGVFVAAFCWIWFETDETGVHGHRRNVVTALLAVVDWLGAAAAVWTSLTICLLLLYRGDHWLSDIVAGAVVAVALMLLLCRLIGATGLPDRVVRFSAAHPPVFYTIAWLFALEIAQLFGDVQVYVKDVVRLARALRS